MWHGILLTIVHISTLKFRVGKWLGQCQITNKYLSDGSVSSILISNWVAFFVFVLCFCISEHLSCLLCTIYQHNSKEKKTTKLSPLLFPSLDMINIKDCVLSELGSQNVRLADVNNDVIQPLHQVCQIFSSSTPLYTWQDFSIVPVLWLSTYQFPTLLTRYIPWVCCHLSQIRC